MLKKSLTLVVATVAAGLTACNERQVATGAAVAGGALIAGAIAGNYSLARYYYSEDGFRPNYYKSYGSGNSDDDRPGYR